VLRSALIMLDAVRRPALDRYLRKIQYLSEQWGEVCWGVLYQADVRCRGEHMETLHHTHLHNHNNAVTAGTTTTYNSLMPWDAVWDEATKDSEWWKAEFEMPAMKIKFERLPPSRVLADNVQDTPHRPQRPQKPKPKAQPKKTICRDFNAGKCPQSTNGHQCPRHLGAEHKCSNCGTPGHGANDCGRKDIQKRKPDDPAWNKWGDKKKRKGGGR
jgi:hypothetical protein